jgi:hypothetical protein
MDCYRFTKEFVDKIIQSRKDEGYDDQGAHSYAIGFVESRIGSILTTLKYQHPEAFKDVIEFNFPEMEKKNG